MTESSENWPEPVSSIQSMQLDLPPSCIEFCPCSPSYFLIGTYNLEGYEGPAAATEAKESEKQEAEQHDDDDDDDIKTAATGGEKKAPQSRDGSILTFQLVDNQL